MHLMPSRPFPVRRSWMQTLDEVIVDVRKMVVVMEPWDKPAPLQRHADLPTSNPTDRLNSLRRLLSH